jgi:siroheme synthase-like protein
MRKFETADIDGRFCVISATDSEPLNAEIYRLCSLRNILVNTVDDKEKCSFIFPALSVADDITIGISTSGKSPIYAKFLRERTDSLLSGKTLAAAEILADYRPVIKREFAGEDERKEVNAALLNLCLCGDTLPNDNEINELIGRMKENYDKENQNRNEEIKACNGTDRPCG